MTKLSPPHVFAIGFYPEFSLYFSAISGTSQISALISTDTCSNLHVMHMRLIMY